MDSGEDRVEQQASVQVVLQELLDALRQSGLQVIEAYLYGSHASGTADADSDIDVAVVSDQLAGVRHEDWFRLNRIASRIDARLEVLGFQPGQFRDENPLVWEIKRTGMSLPPA